MSEINVQLPSETSAETKKISAGIEENIRIAGLARQDAWRVFPFMAIARVRCYSRSLFLSNSRHRDRLHLQACHSPDVESATVATKSTVSASSATASVTNSSVTTIASKTLRNKPNQHAGLILNQVLTRLFAPMDLLSPIASDAIALQFANHCGDVGQCR